MEFIGVRNAVDVMLAKSLKRDALMFDRLAVPGHRFLDFVRPILTNEIDYLFDEGFIFEPTLGVAIHDADLIENATLCADENYQKHLLSEFYWLRRGHKVLNPKKKKSRLSKRAQEIGAVHTILGLQYHSYRVSRYLREKEHVEACAVFERQLPPPIESTVRTDVIDITLRAIPIPEETVSWEQIFEFRSDPNSRKKFLALRNWMNDVGRAGLDPVEIQQKLEHLMSEYSAHLNLHRMKTSPGVLRTLVIGIADATENVMKMNFGKLARQLFFIHHKRVALMDAEATAPGKEVAYIYNATQKFGTDTAWHEKPFRVT